METTTDGPPPFGERAGLAAGLVAVSASFLIAHFIVRRRADPLRALGLADLPLPTQLVLTYFDGSALWFWASVVVALVVAAFSLSGKLGRTGWIPILILAGAALITPAVAYVAVEMPVVKVDRALRSR
jgi:hypothetical protein